MFLQGQTSHEPLLTVVTLTGSTAMTLGHVVLHGLDGDEPQTAALAEHLAVLPLEGRLEVGVQEVLVLRVIGLNVVLEDVVPGEVGMTESTLVLDPSVFLS